MLTNRFNPRTIEFAVVEAVRELGATRAAHALGVAVSTVYRWCNEHDPLPIPALPWQKIAVLCHALAEAGKPEHFSDLVIEVPPCSEDILQATTRLTSAVGDLARMVCEDAARAGKELRGRPGHERAELGRRVAAIVLSARSVASTLADPADDISGRAERPVAPEGIDGRVLGQLVARAAVDRALPPVTAWTRGSWRPHAT